MAFADAVKSVVDKDLDDLDGWRSMIPTANEDHTSRSSGALSGSTWLTGERAERGCDLSW